MFIDDVIRNLGRRSQTLRKAVTATRRQIRRRRRHRYFSEYFQNGADPRLQLGSGGHTLNGWLNTDGDSRDYFLDITEGFPFR